MSKRTYQLIIGITGAVAAGVVAVVTYVGPEYAAAINGAIGIAATAVSEACALFVKSE